MKIVGKRSKRQAVTMIAAGCAFNFICFISLFIVISLNGNKNFAFETLEYAVLGAICLLTGVIFTCKGIRNLNKDSELIALNDDSVVFLTQKQEIFFSEIESIIPRRAAESCKKHIYGTLIIYIKDGKNFKQADVEDVEQFAVLLNVELSKFMADGVKYSRTDR